MNCEFEKAWVGPCGKQNCKKHAELKCVSCGAKATRECDATIGLVCGCPICDDCTHTLTKEGVYSQGFDHCKKADQKHLPWYRQHPAA